MRTYVFEDIDIGGGWRAMIAVSPNAHSGKLFISGFMAFNERHDEFDDIQSNTSDAYASCCEWLDANRDNIPALHAEQMKKIRGRRALVKDVEGYDPALGAQTRDVALRAVVHTDNRPMTVQDLTANLFPQLACDGTNHDSPDADWRDGDRH